jgi:hypothetical protein
MCACYFLISAVLKSLTRGKTTNSRKQYCHYEVFGFSTRTNVRTPKSGMDWVPNVRTPKSGMDWVPSDRS